MTKRIGDDLHRATGAFRVPRTNTAETNILDFGLAPGGFLYTAINRNPGCRARGFSLPTSDGGYGILLKNSPGISLKYRDVTMLAADMGVTEIPAKHQDAANFLPREFEPTESFDIVVCGGQVVRKHESLMASYREGKEARRLSSVQLVLGLEHIKEGGNMVVVLHKPEAWDTVCLLYTFNKFSTVKIFKPTRAHKVRSSFYMVATDIQPRHAEALRSVERWKTWWKTATFGTDEEYAASLRENDVDVEKVLEDFGAELIRLGRPVWKTQAEALAKASFIRHA